MKVGRTLARLNNTTAFHAALLCPCRAHTTIFVVSCIASTDSSAGVFIFQDTFEQGEAVGIGLLEGVKGAAAAVGQALHITPKPEGEYHDVMLCFVGVKGAFDLAAIAACKGWRRR
eukprot:360774-Chlamydomonas_euryale.AAC.7